MLHRKLEKSSLAELELIISLIENIGVNVGKKKSMTIWLIWWMKNCQIIEKLLHYR
jgi:hypothetical protein